MSTQVRRHKPCKYLFPYIRVQGSFLGFRPRESYGDFKKKGRMDHAGTGDQVLVERLLEVGVPMGAADAAGWTPLSWAAGSGHADCVSRLLEAGAGVGAKDSQGRLPLHWAAERGWAQVVALLVPAMLQGGLDLHAPVRSYKHPIRWLRFRRAPLVAFFLLPFGPQIGALKKSNQHLCRWTAMADFA